VVQNNVTAQVAILKTQTTKSTRHVKHAYKIASPVVIQKPAKYAINQKVIFYYKFLKLVNIAAPDAKYAIKKNFIVYNANLDLHIMKLHDNATVLKKHTNF
jgi:hypothetical protein